MNSFLMFWVLPIVGTILILFIFRHLLSKAPKIEGRKRSKGAGEDDRNGA
ncbi:MAG: hypothetical protein AAFR21_12890 [Pseudomonadota bacterium]